MKKLTVLLIILLPFNFLNAQIKAPGVNWNETYSFDKFNVFKVYFFAKNNELMTTLNYKTYFQSEGKDFDVIQMDKNSIKKVETVFDLANEVAIQIFFEGYGDEPYYNTGGFKYPNEEDRKILNILPAEGTKTIAGLECKKYTYTYKKIFGEVWITDQCNLSNDYGIFRAAKMSAKHNTLSIGGFVMEMTTEDSGGGKTVMTTISLENNEKYITDFRKVKMNTSINKISYYTF